MLTAPECLPLCPYSPLCDFKQPGLLKPCLTGEGSFDLALSQESCSRLGGHRAWGWTCPCPCAGPRDLIVLKHSPYCLVFQYPLQLLFSCSHICWGTVGCSLCSSVDWLGVSPVCRGSGLCSHLSRCHLRVCVKCSEYILMININMLANTT